jgi:poly-gamma-glutamate capsule biosynthesis protein CapA/YwtB (metallophosphatase superfamily)
VTRPTASPRSHRRVAAAVLTALVAVTLASCTIERATPKSSGTTQATDPPTAAPGTTAAPRAAAKPGQARGAAVTIAFGGDVHFEGAIERRLARDPETALGPIATVLRRADLAMVNLETAITTRGSAQDKAFTFRAPASAFRALRAAGIDVVTMANNHGMDFGSVGLADSMEAAADAGVPVVGIGRDVDQAFSPYVARINGQRIAIIGATQVLDDNLAAAWTAGEGKPGLASAYLVDRLLTAVRAARRKADTVVVDLHWGRELSGCPIDRQRQLAPRLVEAGADIVVGSHAHVLLGGGYMKTAYVDYGLGNFVFYSGGGVTAQSGVLNLTVQGRAVTRARWIPAVISGGIPIPLEGAAADRAVASWTALRGCTGLAAAPVQTS